MNPKFKKRKWIYRGRKFSVAIETFAIARDSSRRKGQFLPIDQRDAKNRPLRTVPREIIYHSGSVVIIPRLADGRLVLIRQYRYPSRKMLWEFPAGTRDQLKGRVEGARVCAYREIQEEIGFRAGRLKRLGGFYLAPGTSTEYMEVYLAEKLKPSVLPKDADEIIAPHSFTLRQIQSMLRKGLIQDSKTIAAFQLLGI
jgi:ADP-ribose pyrophosphatase